VRAAHAPVRKIAPLRSYDFIYTNSLFHFSSFPYSNSARPRKTFIFLLKNSCEKKFLLQEKDLHIAKNLTKKALTAKKKFI
jgi:hypothetical protein